MKIGKFEIPPKKEEVNLINELKSIQARLEEEQGYWDDGIYNDYLNIIKNINPNSLNDEERFLYKNVLKNQLNILIEGNEGGTYGWNLDSNFSSILRKFIDIKNPKLFNDNMEILTTINEFYGNFNWDELKPEIEGKRPIEELVDSLYNDSQENDSNLLLSFYIKQIKEGNSGMDYSQGLVESTLVYIGDSRYADISLASFYPESVKISKKENLELINDLLKEKDELEKEYKNSIKNEEKSSKDEDNFIILNDKKFFGIKYNNDYEEKENIYKNKKHHIFMKIEKLINEDITNKTFSKSNNLKGSTLDPVVFSTIWSDEGLRQEIEKKIGIVFRDFNLPEQSQILNFLKDLNNGKSDEIKIFSDKYQKDGFRTFLSIEQGGKEMGDKILELGNPEKLPEDIARKVFAKYGEIIDTADKAEDEVKKLYEKENIPNEVFVFIKETLLKRGADLLSNMADGVNNSKETIKEEDILKELEDIKTSTIIMGQSYIELYKQGIKVPIEDITNTTLEKISAQNLSEENKKELIKVYENGRPKETYENEEHIKLLKDEFEETLNNKDTFVFNIRFNNEIVAFATFNKESEDTLHIGGLTFIDDVRNPAVGNAVMASIMNEFKNFNIKALVHSQNKVLAMYQKRFGFKIIKELPLEENAGELYYEIEKRKASESIQMDTDKEKIKEAA